jgi:hypothetical protein
MSDHRFSYTVSGIHLSDDQRIAISQAIAAAVADVLLGDDPGAVRADCLTLHRIYGGKWIDVAERQAIEADDGLAARLPAIVAGEQ